MSKEQREAFDLLNDVKNWRTGIIPEHIIHISEAYAFTATNCWIIDHDSHKVELPTDFLLVRKQLCNEIKNEIL